jgi:hypothetical protein
MRAEFATSSGTDFGTEQRYVKEKIYKILEVVIFYHIKHKSGEDVQYTIQEEEIHAQYDYKTNIFNI